MAIHIVKQGKLPETVPYGGTCSRCKTQIECKQGDTFNDSQGDQREASLRYVVCPTCKSDMIVTELKLVFTNNSEAQHAAYDGSPYTKYKG